MEKVFLENLDRRDSHELMMSAILPRPIALVSTIGEDQIFNIAPFSCYAPICMKPALICFGISWRRNGQKKDTLKNIESRRDFVINIVDENLAEAMNRTSADYPSAVDEFREVGLTPTKSDLVSAPRVAESPVHMECRLVNIQEFGKVPTGYHLIIGEVVLIHVKEELWNGDHIDISKLRVIGRLGEQLYCRVTDIFEMKRPEIPDWKGYY